MSAPTETPPAILIVDDHEANLLALEAVLAPLGHRLVMARSGSDALLKSLQEDFVLMMIDVHMPGLDGYETVELLRKRKRTRDVPIVFLTAIYDLQEQVHLGYALGAADYVTKPFDPVVLRAKVSALVSLYTRGRAEERARREELDRLKDLFLGAVGHDLRNPLNTLLLQSQGLARTTREEETRRGLQRMERAVRRMGAIVDDVLDLTRANFSGSIPIKVAPADVAELARNVIAEVRSVHADRTIVLEASGPTSGEWDVVRLARAISNVVTNAAQHASEGDVIVRIAGAAERVVLSVHNRGAPISPSVLPHVFEPFRRGEVVAEGLGLGLYIVREIVRAHEGTVHIASNDVDGTTFTLELPRKTRHAEAAART